MDNVEEEVRRILVEYLGVEPAAVTTAARVADDLGADSLDSIEITMAVEEMFDIEVTDAEMNAVETVSDIEILVRAKLVTRGSP